MILYLDGKRIDTLYEAYLWLREAWCYEPYNMWYEEFGEKGSECYRECIFIEPVRGYDDLNGGIFVASKSLRYLYVCINSKERD